MEIREFDRRALEGTGRVVAQVTEDRLGAPTPCAGWDLRTLLVHMAGNNNGFAEAAEGRPADPAVWAGEGIAEGTAGRTGADVVGEYRKSAQRVAAAFAAPGVLDRNLEVHGFGSFPAQVAIGMHFIDYLVHGWDVAKAIDVDHPLDPELCRAVLKIGAGWPPDSPAIWGPGAPFGKRVPIPEDASPEHRMLGFLGRTPRWPAA
jgi:uncharacterized protein (TIGR03086 family)